MTLLSLYNFNFIIRFSYMSFIYNFFKYNVHMFVREIDDEIFIALFSYHYLLQK
jgi:hypothetical protein